MGKQEERDYPLKTEPWHLYRKPYDCARTFREFALAVDVLRKHVPSSDWILDLGCGSGWSTILLNRAGWGAVGVDISERMIEIARERALGEAMPAEFLVSDIEELDLDKRDFGAVFIFDALHHCPGHAEVLRRACEHLRPGGYLLLMEPSWLHLYSPHARKAIELYGVTELGFSRWYLHRLLKQVGFRSVQSYYDTGTIYRGLGGFLLANLRLWCSYLSCFPQTKQIILARK